MQTIRNIIKALTRPLSLFWVMITLSIIMYMFYLNTISLIILLLALTYLLFISTPWIPEYLLRNLENKYPYLLDLDEIIKNNKKVLILTLAAGNSNDKRLSHSAQLHLASKNRIIEALRLYKTIPNSKLVFTGGGEASLSSAELHKQAIMELGVSENEITTIPKGWNTLTEARAFEQWYNKQTTLIMVTDAVHMPRAMVIFNDLGINPIPAPTTFRLRQNNYKRTITDYFPSAHYIDYFELWFYAISGNLWLKIAHGK